MSRARRPLSPLLLAPLLLTATLLPAPPALARDALGVFSTWAAFRDPAIPRCYAIAQPALTTGPSTAQTDYQPFAALGTWPRRGIHTALHLRLSHRLAPGAPITLSLAGVSIGAHRYHLVGGDGDAWPATPRDDAAIAAALRSAATLNVSARAISGHLFTDSYPLSGAATAMDAAALGCAGLK
jgi:hypothetical protein